MRAFVKRLSRAGRAALPTRTLAGGGSHARTYRNTPHHTTTFSPRAGRGGRPPRWAGQCWPAAGVGARSGGAVRIGGGACIWGSSWVVLTRAGPPSPPWQQKLKLQRDSATRQPSSVHERGQGTWPGHVIALHDDAVPNSLGWVPSQPTAGQPGQACSPACRSCLRGVKMAAGQRRAADRQPSLLIPPSASPVDSSAARMPLPGAASFLAVSTSSAA